MIHNTLQHLKHISLYSRFISLLVCIIMLSMMIDYNAYADNDDTCYYPTDTVPRTFAQGRGQGIFTAEIPQVIEVSKWIKTDITIKQGDTWQIYGRIYPWSATGSKNAKVCKFIKSSEIIKKYPDYIEDAGVIDAGNGQDGWFLEPIVGNLGCYVKDGMGLYGLIVPDGADINNNINFAYNPYARGVSSFHFYEMRLNDSGDSIGDSAAFMLKKSYRYNSSGKLEVVDKPSGRLYIKFMDSFYSENRGAYEVIFLDSKTTGLIEEILSHFARILKRSQDSLFQKVAENIKNLALTLVYLYFAISALSFVIGNAAMTQGEIFIRTLKIAVILTLVQTNSMGFLEKNLFNLATAIPNTISAIIADVDISTSSDIVKKEIPKGVELDGIKSADVVGVTGLQGIATAANGMQPILDVITALVTHLKILSLIFSSKIYFVILLYALIIIYISIILELVLLCLLTLVRFSLLVIMYPIFILFILFKVTAELFKYWVNQIVAIGVLVIMIGIVTKLMNATTIESFKKLISFTICERTFLLIPYYAIQDSPNIDEVLNLADYLKTLITTLAFAKVIGGIPKMADGFSGTMLGGLSSMYGAGKQSAKGVYSSMKKDLRGISKAIGNTSLAKKVKNSRLATKLGDTKRRLSPTGIFSKAILAGHKVAEKISNTYSSTLGSFIHPSNPGDDLFSLKAKKKNWRDQDAAKASKEAEKQSIDAHVEKRLGLSHKGDQFMNDDQCRAFIDDYNNENVNISHAMKFPIPEAVLEERRGVAQSLMKDNREYKILSKMTEEFKDNNKSPLETLNDIKARSEDPITNAAIASIENKLDIARQGNMDDNAMIKKVGQEMHLTKEKIYHKNDALYDWSKRVKR